METFAVLCLIRRKFRKNWTSQKTLYGSFYDVISIERSEMVVVISTWLAACAKDE